MRYVLYLHPESDCLFWSDGEEEGDGLLVEVGRSDSPDMQTARTLYYSHAIAGFEHKQPSFDN